MGLGTVHPRLPCAAPGTGCMTETLEKPGLGKQDARKKYSFCAAFISSALIMKSVSAPGWVLGEVANVLLGCLRPVWDSLGLSPGSAPGFSFLLMQILGGQQVMMAQIMGSLFPTRET